VHDYLGTGNDDDRTVVPKDGVGRVNNLLLYNNIEPHLLPKGKLDIVELDDPELKPEFYPTWWNGSGG
jgi:hypothetical protein